MHLKSSKSFCKHLSYCGAVRVLEGTPLEFGHWEDDRRIWYVDPGNNIYDAVFRRVWPHGPAALGMSNVETLADLMEALLSWHYCFTVTNGQPLQPIAVRFIDQLNLALFCDLALQYVQGNATKVVYL